MKKAFTTLLILLQFVCFSQESKQHQKLRFQSLNQIGFVSGQTNTEPIFQTINGFQFQTLFVGAGIGLDYYKKRSVPIFLDIRKNVLKKSMTPFVYVDGGYHFAWVNDEPEEWISKSYDGGLYFDAGVGYSFPVFKSSSFTVSLGYSSKEMFEERNNNPWRSSWPQEDDFETLHYKLRRYSFKMGLTF